MATMKDVAKYAGVSLSTVSNVINGSKYVSPELQERVRDAIIALDYKPNKIAQSLMKKSSGQIGFIVDDVRNPFYAEVARGLDDAARSEGFVISICTASENTGDYFKEAIQRQFDGIYMGGGQFELASFLENTDIPVVAGSEIGDMYGCSVVDCDYISGLDQVIKYLSDLGHRRIGFLNGSGEDSEKINNARYRGYRNAIQKYQLEFDDILVYRGKPGYKATYEHGYAGMKELLARDVELTAVFAYNDVMAFGAMQAIQEAGLKISEDISVVGCDDIFLSKAFNPKLTTLKVPKYDMGRLAFSTLRRQLRTGKTDRHILYCDLVVRESTGLAKRT